MVYSKHKFKISTFCINDSLIKCIRNNDIKIINFKEKDYLNNKLSDDTLILSCTDRMAEDISDKIFCINPKVDNNTELINTYNILFTNKHFNVDDYFLLLKILKEECCCQIFDCDFKNDVCTVFVQGLKNEIWLGIDEFIRKYDDFTLEDFTVSVVD